jgi:hypothetical protein
MKIQHFVLSLTCAILLCSLPGRSQQQENSGAPSVPTMHFAESRQPVHVVDYGRSQTMDVEFLGTYLMPRAHGTAKVEATNGGFKIEAHLEAMGRASEIDPSYLTYVLWAIPQEAGSPQNLGEMVLKDKTSTLTAFTDLRTFALIVTAEPYFAVKQPSMFIILENIMRTPSEDPNFVRADLLQLRPDSKTPLDVYEARNAVRLARLAGAERYSASTFHRALQLLQQAEALVAHNRGKTKDTPELKAMAREATEAAEQARVVAAEYLHQANPLRPAMMP